MNGNVIKVTIWDKTVGYLQWDKQDWKRESSVFQFDKKFLSEGLDISPLMMPIDSPWIRQGKSFRAGDPKGDFKGLPSVFADSLPDHWGRSIFRSWAKEKGVKMKSFTPVDFLSFIGTRGMGALEYHPSLISEENVPFDVNVNQLYDFAKSALNDVSELTYSSDRELLWQDLVKLGTSPGGKRPKALIAINETTKEVKSGQTMLPAGFDYYILKYDNEKDAFPYAKLEYAYYRLCRDCGIKIMPSQLRRFDDASHFITKRFDRVDGKKVHKLSLMAMAGDIRSYEEAFDTVRKLRLPYLDSEQLFRQMTFNVLAGNIDDHARNFAFLMDESGTWSLSPAYDVVYSIDPSLMETQKGQFMSVNGKFNGITAEDIISLGRENDIINPKETMSTTLDALATLPAYLKDLGVSKNTFLMMEKELNKKYVSLNLPKTFSFSRYDEDSITMATKDTTGKIHGRDRHALLSLGVNDEDIAILENAGKLIISEHYYRPTHSYDDKTKVPMEKAILEFSFRDNAVFVLSPDKKRETSLRQALASPEGIARFKVKDKSGSLNKSISVHKSPGPSKHK